MMSRKSWNEKSCLAAACGAVATAVFAAACGVSEKELPVINMAHATQGLGQRKSQGLRRTACWHRQCLPIYLPLVGRSKSRSAAKRFRVGNGRGEMPPPEKSFGFFDLPTRGRFSFKE